MKIKIGVSHTQIRYYIKIFTGLQFHQAPYNNARSINIYTFSKTFYLTKFKFEIFFNSQFFEFITSIQKSSQTNYTSLQSQFAL
jgi:hypothetical protein